MNQIFDWCVDLLYWMAGVTGLTYEEVNVLLFVFIHPLITLILIMLLISKQREIKALKMNRRVP